MKHGSEYAKKVKRLFQDIQSRRTQPLEVIR